MRLILASLGRWHKGPEQALFEHYAARFTPLGRRLGLGPLELLELGDKRRDGAGENCQRLLDASPAGGYRIALDAKGAPFLSEQLSTLIGQLRDDARPALSFLIGGADGLAPILPQADKVLSLGAQTWPHLLVRGLVAEQLYRAATILLNHPYHCGH